LEIDTTLVERSILTAASDPETKVRPMTSGGRSIEQTNHRLIRDALREALRQAMRAGSGAAGGIDSIECRATAVLYTLLLEHPIDQRGRCRSCRGSGAIIGLRRCRVHFTAHDWLLLQPDKATLLSHLARELGLGAAPPPGAGSLPDRSLLTITSRAVEPPQA
jgi:hypothetical protein